MRTWGFTFPSCSTQGTRSPGLPPPALQQHPGTFLGLPPWLEHITSEGPASPALVDQLPYPEHLDL